MRRCTEHALPMESCPRCRPAWLVATGQAARFYPGEDTAAARLLDQYAPIASQQPGLQNNIEWQRRDEMTEMVKAIEEEAHMQNTGRSYTDTVTLPGDLTLETAEAIEEKFRGYGSVERKGRRITFTLVEEDDWNLREVLAELEQEVGSYGVNFSVDKSKVVGK